MKNLVESPENIDRPLSTSGRIITTGAKSARSTHATHQVDDIPFVPAFDLLATSIPSSLGDEEVACIASALWSLPDSSSQPKITDWQRAARIFAISQRF